MPLYRLPLLHAVALIGLFAAVCASHAHAAPRKQFVWADADGTVHTSAQLADVAEPYLSLYRAEALATVQARGACAGGATATGLEADRSRWQDRVRTARGQLLAATLAWAQLQAAAQTVQVNPILRLLPAAQEKPGVSPEVRAQAKARLSAARKALEETLPEEARRAHVPMAWLQ